MSAPRFSEITWRGVAFVVVFTLAGGLAGFAIAILWHRAIG